MNIGFRLEIEKGLSLEQDGIARQHCQEFINDIVSKGSWKHMTHGGYVSYLKRGVFGELIDPKNLSTQKTGLVFRRMSNHRRIFAVIRTVNLDTSNINLNQCKCPKHLGGTKIKLLNYPEVYTFYEFGNIKG